MNEPTYRLISKNAHLVLYGDTDEAIHIGRQFYATCLNAGNSVTTQKVLPGKRYRDSHDADALFRPKL